jgi:pimeloyl-ACP methyl ester carboxylesterase
MDAMGLERAHIGGFSMGGSITSQLMARAPERFITAHFGGSGVREEPESEFANGRHLPRGLSRRADPVHHPVQAEALKAFFTGALIQSRFGHGTHRPRRCTHLRCGGPSTRRR